MNPTAWPARLLVVDVEGNGANPPDLVEAAALPLVHGRIDVATAGWWQVKPPRPVTPRAANIHGLTNDHLADKPPWSAVADDVHAGLEQAWIGAHHAHVDYKALRSHLPGWEPAGVLDTLRLAKATYPDLTSYSLDALIERLRPDLAHAPGQRHGARYDAYAAAQLLLIMAARYDTWDRLVSAAVPPGLPGAPQPVKEDTLW